MCFKICFFGDGLSTHTQRWVHEISTRGFETFLVTNRPGDFPNTKIVEIPECKNNFSWFLQVPYIRRVLYEINPDVVHGHYITSYGFWAAASGVRPLVLTAWGSDILVTPKKSMLMRLLTGWTLKKADLITADARHVLDEIKLYHPSGKLEEVQWGVDIEKFKPKRIDDSDVVQIISLRSWEAVYNIDVIINAFARLVSRMPSTSLHLHLLGGGSLEGELRQLVHSKRLSNLVTFHGRLNEDRTIALLQNASISVSVPSSDATAMSVLESMAVGLPVIVSDLPANREWVDNEGGRIVPARDEEALCLALEELSKDRVLRSRMGKKNRNIIKHRANRRTEMDRMAELYSELIRSKRRRS